MRKNNFMLYKIYYLTEEDEDRLVYIGRAKGALNDRLRKLFFKGPGSRILDIGRVSRIEYVPFRTRADMLVAERILINRHKPELNREQKAHDELTLELPDFPSLPYQSVPLERWKREIKARDAAFERVERKRLALFEAHRNKRREIFSQKELPAEEKAKRWTTWLVKYYEPTMEELNDEEVMTW